MNNLSRMTVKLITVTQVLALTLLAACTTVGSALGATSDTTTSTNVCLRHCGLGDTDAKIFSDGKAMIEIVTDAAVPEYPDGIDNPARVFGGDAGNRIGGFR